MVPPPLRRDAAHARGAWAEEDRSARARARERERARSPRASSRSPPAPQVALCAFEHLSDLPATCAAVAAWPAGDGAAEAAAAAAARRRLREDDEYAAIAAADAHAPMPRTFGCVHINPTSKAGHDAEVFAIKKKTFICSIVLVL